MASSRRGWGKKLLWTLVLGGVFSGSGLLGVLTVVYSMVYFGDDSALKKSTILARIHEETAIYMRDGETHVGSIFSSGHRRYVPIDEVPAHMINAIIAAEDKHFYEHPGVDPIAIVSAGLSFLQTGDLRGASTLTQQTVRNIMGWWEVTLSRKFREWVAALQIERLYGKRQILEFYLNQFYVSGNGNGIGIAAKYYFDKSVQDLNLVESAFIAGSVKGPSLYDPFIKYTKKAREKAVQRAFDRKNYVLRRMYEQGWISKSQFKEAFEKPVRFNRGRFRTDEVTLVQTIRSELGRDEILDAVGLEDARELSSAGFKIYTTIDKDIQQSAQLAMRRNLSRLETILEGFSPEDPEKFKKLRNLQEEEFYFAKVTGVEGTREKPNIQIDFGLPKGVIPYKSLMRYAKWLDLAEGQGWEKQLQELIDEISVGDVLFVEVREYDSKTHEVVAELQKRPVVNGGMMAVDKGDVRAVISGFDTKGFNRAITARRQPGSVFKPVVYFGALQMGWSLLDRLDNERQLFPYQGRFYYPRPDHQSPYKETSVLYAGVMSENLASVHLASRIVEKLNLKQFKQLMESLGLAPEEDESPRDFHYRVAREVGVQLTNEGVKEYQLRNAIDDLLLDVQYTTTFSLQSRLRKMWFGRGYKDEMQAIYLTDDDELHVSRKALRLRLLRNNYQRHSVIDSQLVEDWETIKAAVEEQGYQEAFRDPSLQHVFKRFRVLPGRNNRPAVGYRMELEGEKPKQDYRHKARLDRELDIGGRKLNPLDVEAIWGGDDLMGTSAGIKLGDVKLNGWLQHNHFALLRQYVDRHYQNAMSRRSKYDLARYWQHHDFRIGLGLKYLVELVKKMGVENKVEPVLSFPLGTNVVSVAEVAKIYQTFIEGKTYRYYENGPKNQLNYIKRIEDRYGNVIYEPERKSHQLVRPEFAYQIREILRRVVTHGTGRRARGELYLTLGDDEDEKAPGGGKDGLTRIRIPAFGKTGTTNDYTNAYFAGFVPYPKKHGKPLNPENSYVLAAYVGYDMNRTMSKNYFSISGAQGALPAWISLAKSIIKKKDYDEYVDSLDLSVISGHKWPLKFPSVTTPVRIDMPRGVLLSRGGQNQESYGLTDLETTGESRYNEFRANVVKSTVRLPMSSDGSAMRMFDPFQPLPDEGEAATEIQASKIEEKEGSGQKGLNLSEGQPKGDSPADANAPSDSGGGESGLDDVRAYDDQGNRIQRSGAGSSAGSRQPSTSGGDRSRPGAEGTTSGDTAQRRDRPSPSRPNEPSTGGGGTAGSDEGTTQTGGFFDDVTGGGGDRGGDDADPDADDSGNLTDDELWDANG